ncbi:MAG: MFS transporter [Thiothrix sp.]|nr:MFS transporter [Thiothrix sp.]HPQ95850.1 MDR family MFS transporter [Thiolinea sp.]
MTPTNQVSVSRSHRDALVAMAGLSLSLFLVSLDQTVVGTAMPKIIADLNGFELYAWVATAYLLAQTVALPIVGKLGDIYGRKWIAISGVLIFVGASAFCGMAPSMPWLIIGRALQGIGAGTIMATTFTLVADIFPDLRERARYQGILFAVFALSSVIGPPLGGWITDLWGWRWIFYINLPLGLLSLLVLPRVLPQSLPRPHARIDVLGALSISTCIIALLLALEMASSGATWDSPAVIGGLLTAVVALLAFIPAELRAQDPIIPFVMFRNRTISATVTVMFLFGMCMFGLFLYIPLFLQAVMGLTASASGLLMLPMSFAMPVVGIAVGQAIARIGVLRPFFVGGTAVMCLGVFLLGTLTADSSHWLVAAYLFLTALGMGSIFPVSNLLVQSAAGPELLGVVTSTTQFLRLIGSTVGTALIGTLITSGYLRGMAAAPADIPAAALQALESPNALVSESSLAQLSIIMQPLPEAAGRMQQLLDLAREALSNAIHTGFVVMFGVILLAFGLSLLVQKLKLLERSKTGELHEADVMGG